MDDMDAAPKKKKNPLTPQLGYKGVLSGEIESSDAVLLSEFGDLLPDNRDGIVEYSVHVGVSQ